MSHPVMAFSLPGQWVKVPVTAPDARRRFVEAVTPQVGPKVGSDLAGRLSGFAAVGGDLMMLRTATSQPVLVLTSWPQEHEADQGHGIVRLREWISSDSSEESVELDNVHGYSALRVPSDDGLEGRPRMLYWVSDPVKGRLFCMDVTYFGPPSRDDTDYPTPWFEPYDLLVEQLRWKEQAHDD